MSRGIQVADISDANNRNIDKQFTLKCNTTNNLHQSANDDHETSSIHITKAEDLFFQACEMEQKTDLNSFKVFRRALDAFQVANSIEKQNFASLMGIAKCLIKLYQFKRAFDVLETLSKYKEPLTNPQYYCLYGICCRKLTKIWNGNLHFSKKFVELEKAQSHLNKAIIMESNNNEINNQKKITDNLQNLQRNYKRNFKKYLNFMASEYEISNSCREKALFKILSIDGGGVRGILPAVLLLEIEKRCHCYLKDVFDMFTGTSIGALIASSYVVPEAIGSTKPSRCTADTLEFYMKHAKNIFPSSFLSNFKRIFAPKYSNQGLHDTIKSLTKDYRMGDTLKELIIPAVNCEVCLLHTEYFSTHAARNNNDRNVLLSDVLMATCAAPTYFPSYEIKGLGCFVDGSLTTQNPSKNAFETAKRQFSRRENEIFMLSMGTGTLATDLFEEKLNTPKSMIHWISNIPLYIIKGQANNTHRYLQSVLDYDKYNRLDVYLENSIPIDDNDYLTDLIDLGTEYVEENTDRINKIVEVLLEK
jgi:patatin-like phospholipase/acyl hydrolase